MPRPSYQVDRDRPSHQRLLLPSSQQVAALRKQDESWYMLPDEGDDGINYLDFRVEIEAPDFYTVDPTPPSSATAGVDARAASASRRELPYKGGVFSVQLTFSEAYPAEPPAVRFQTRIWHPQVHLPDGKPCVDVLSKGWGPAKTLRDVLDTLRQLIAEPSSTDSVNTEAAAELADGLEKFEQHAREVTRAFAIT